MLTWVDYPQLAEFCLELDSCDFRVQASVAKDFSHLAEWAECRSCSENAAFQLALCYTFGFGVRADSEQSRKWLLCSGKNNDDLNEALRRIKLMKPRLSAISQLVNLGFEGQLTSAYDADGILEQAIREYQAMTAARLQAFGPEHFLTIRMNNLLADVLCATDKEEEVVQASEIYKEGIRMLDKLYGPKNRATLVAKTGLARAYINLRLFKEAEIVAMEVFESYSSESEDDVALRLAALCDLASIALECGKYDKAIERGLEVIESGKEHLGPSQANVMRAKSVLALAYFRSGLAQEGVQLAEEAHKEKSVALGQEHPATLRSLQDLATMCTISSEWMKARNAWKEYSEMIQKLGFTARSILIARSNYAVTLARTGDAEIAVRICEDILSDMARNSKCMQEDVFGTKANLAIAHSYQNAWHKAEPLQREVLSFFQQRLDPCHVRVLLSLQGLSETLYHREKWDEAAEFASQEIRNRESVSSELDTDKLDALTRITRSKAELQKWADAVPQLEKELMWRKQMAKADSFDGLIATALTAIGQLHAHKREQAVDRIGEFFEAFKHIGLGNEYLVEQIYAMAAGAEENGLLEEAEECLKLALLCRRNIFPGTQGPRQEADEKRVLELRRRLGKSTVLEEIKLELTSTLIKRRREAQKQERP